MNKLPTPAKFLLGIVILVIFACAMMAARQTHAEGTNVGSYKLMEMRYCGPPARGTKGEILRDKSVIAAFKAQHVCPSTGKTTGACDGWAIDHVIPLACGGCDAVSNMQWMPDKMKNYAGDVSKDRWERKVYAKPDVYDGHACKFEVIPEN